MTKWFNNGSTPTKVTHLLMAAPCDQLSARASGPRCATCCGESIARPINTLSGAGIQPPHTPPSSPHMDEEEGWGEKRRAC
jgi:hypothetical protein